MHQRPIPTNQNKPQISLIPRLKLHLADLLRPKRLLNLLNQIPAPLRRRVELDDVVGVFLARVVEEAEEQGSGQDHGEDSRADFGPGTCYYID